MHYTEQYHFKLHWQACQPVPKRSCLKRQACEFRGLNWLSTFTVWNWLLIGLYFLLASIATTAALLADHEEKEFFKSSAQPFFAFIWAIYQVAFSCSLLVTVVVTFVFVPNAYNRTGHSPERFFTRWNVAMHNLNVVLMSVEFMFNNLPIMTGHWPLCVIWGSIYWLFVWGWYSKTNFYPYFFLDHTLPTAVAVGVQCLFFSGIIVFHFVGVGLASFASEEDALSIQAKSTILSMFNCLVVRFNPRHWSDLILLNQPSKLSC